jgi:hypothetical protein
MLKVTKVYELPKKSENQQDKPLDFKRSPGRWNGMELAPFIHHFDGDNDSNPFHFGDH